MDNHTKRELTQTTALEPLSYTGLSLTEVFRRPDLLQADIAYSYCSTGCEPSFDILEEPPVSHYSADALNVPQALGYGIAPSTLYTTGPGIPSVANQEYSYLCVQFLPIVQRSLAYPVHAARAMSLKLLCRPNPTMTTFTCLGSARLPPLALGPMWLCKINCFQWSSPTRTYNIQLSMRSRGHFRRA